MSNNIRKFTNITSMPERVLSALAYLSFSVVGFVLLIIAALKKTHLKPYVTFNIFQSILVTFIFAFVQFTYIVIVQILEFLKIIPFVGTLLNSFFHFLTYFLIGFPLLFGMSFVALCIIAIIVYLTVQCFMGKIPHIPFVSKAIMKRIK